MLLDMCIKKEKAHTYKKNKQIEMFASLFPFPFRQKHEKGYTVCGMAWHPAGGQIAFTDTEGCLGLLDGVCTSSSSSSSYTTTTKNTTVFISVFQ